MIDLRESKNLSKKEFAHLLGVSREAVQTWEMGTRTPSIQKIIEIADFFNVTIDYLVDHDTKTAVIITKDDYDRLLKARTTIDRILEESKNLF